MTGVKTLISAPVLQNKHSVIIFNISLEYYSTYYLYNLLLDLRLLYHLLGGTFGDFLLGSINLPYNTSLDARASQAIDNI